MKTVTKIAATKMLNDKKIDPTLFGEGYSVLMPKAKAEKWLKALRSGEYTQADGVLHDEHTGGFCCLGVEQYCNNKGYVEIDEDNDWHTLPTKTYLAERGYLFVNKLNNESNNPYDISSDNEIAELNDKLAYGVAVKVNQHKTVYKNLHKHNFKDMAKTLERIILVY